MKRALHVPREVSSLQPESPLVWTALKDIIKILLEALRVKLVQKANIIHILANKVAITVHWEHIRTRLAKVDARDVLQDITKIVMVKLRAKIAQLAVIKIKTARVAARHAILAISRVLPLSHLVQNALQALTQVNLVQFPAQNAH